MSGMILSTREIHPRDRVAYWVDAMSGTILQVDCVPKQRQKFFGEFGSQPIGGFHLGTVALTAQVVTRSPRQIACDGSTAILINIQLNGRGNASQDSRDDELRPGDFTLFDSTMKMLDARWSSI